VDDGGGGGSGSNNGDDGGDDNVIGFVDDNKGPQSGIHILNITPTFS